MKKIYVKAIAVFMAAVSIFSSASAVNAKSKKSASPIKSLTVKSASQGFLYAAWKQSKKVTKTDIYVSENKKKWTKASDKIDERKIFKYEDNKNAFLIGVLKPNKKYFIKVKPYIGKKSQKAVIKSAKTCKKFTAKASDVKAKLTDEGVKVTWKNSSEKRNDIYVFRLIYNKDEKAYIVDKDVADGYVGANPLGKNAAAFTDTVPLKSGESYRWVVFYELNRNSYYKNGEDESFLREQGPLVKSNVLKYEEKS